MYDVSNRESFDALPRWFSELETYVSASVVKIVVGNKVDKEFSRQVPAAEGAAFAARMDSLFIEASAKTAVGVTEAFQELVERIMDTPELWNTCAWCGLVGCAATNMDVVAKSKPAGAPAARAAPATNMPGGGNVTLGADNEWDQPSGGCSC